MSNKKYKPTKIQIKNFIEYLDGTFEPITSLEIPNVYCPPELSGKAKFKDARSFVITNIRQMFNSLTEGNINIIKENLRELIFEKVETEELLNEISKEILKNLTISYQNIKNYIQLLNSISKCCVSLKNKEGFNSKTIGNMFLDNCRIMMLESIDDKTTRRISNYDLDDGDELDKYNNERDTIINLIITLCCLYSQRNMEESGKRLLSISAQQLYPLITNIINLHKECVLKMKKLGNPYEDEDCEDEEEYEILSKISSLYAEQIYAFINEQGINFIDDKTIIKGSNKTMMDIVNSFIEEIFPHITESYMISKCKDLIKTLKNHMNN